MDGDHAPEPLGHLWVIGPGRVGLALGLLLRRAGAVQRLSYSGRRPHPPAHPLFRPPLPAAYRPDLRPPSAPLDAVLISVPDARVRDVAADLAREADRFPAVPVLHTSGSLGMEALEPLAALGAATGSLHPLAAVADSVEGAQRLRGAWFALEGHPAAITVGERLVRAAEGRVLPLSQGGKALYHAAAVFASNYLVALLAVAERLVGQAGAPEAEGRAALVSLAAGAVDNAARAGPAAALTGPVARGDHDTVERHLARLSPEDRVLYSVLAREALALARRRGLDPDAARRIEQRLEEA